MVFRVDSEVDVQKKKLIKDAEKAHRKVAKERERLMKQQEKQEEIRKKQEEKERILNEKRLKKEQEDREREEKRKQKEEEKRLRDQKREEEEQKKEEIRRKKEEEEEEKRKEEAEKERIKNKQKALFTSFFIKKDLPEEKPPKAQVCSVNVSNLFMQFELKKDMMICPVNRVSEDERKAKADSLDSINNSSTNQSNYLLDLKSSQYNPGHSLATWPFNTPDLQIIATKPSSSSGPSTQYSKWMKAKFLQFVENYRPAYFGTWRKSSRNIHSRKPFCQDNRFFDYELDSDDEWEEEEPGENISHSEGENEEEEVPDEEEEDDEEENDGFFVPHGYLSDDEGAEAEDEDVTPEMRKIRQQLEEKQYELSQKKKIQPLRPVINGIRFLNDDEDDDDILRQYKMHVWTQLPIKCSVQEVQVAAAPMSKSPKRKEVPEEALVYLAQILNKNTLNFSKLAYEFRMFWQKLKSGVLPEVSYEEDKKGQSWGLLQISKTQLKNQIKKMASYDGCCWNLLPEIVEMYSTANIINEPWSYVTEINQTQFKPNTSAKKSDKSKKKESASDGCGDPVVISPGKFMNKLSEPTTPSKQNAAVLLSSTCSNVPSTTVDSESKPQKRLYITNFFTPAISPPSKKCKTIHLPSDSPAPKVNVGDSPGDVVEVIVIDS